MNLLDIAIAKKMSGGGGSEPTIEALSVTENGTYTAPSGVDGYNPVTVNVSGGGGITPSGTYSITSNGIYDIVSFASVDVNVSGGGGGDHDVEAAIIQRNISGSYYNSVATIVGIYAFTSCTSLTEARFPIASRVSASAFYSCTQLKKVVLDEANFIGSYAFNNCKALMSVVLLSSAVASLPYTAAFYDTPISKSSYTGSFGSIYVPASLVDSYKSATNWSAYSARITAYEG